MERFMLPVYDIISSMKALVISGGGSKGAWAGGLVEYLSRERGMEWDVLIGSSTGSLLVPCI
ncbi:MAG TPA: patatin-like phospholipase family protein, partial [Saprospiraceae bacterium]|nr:patatin-like phospholipase family protein [Saprospiraceae bacterium]